MKCLIVTPYLPNRLEYVIGDGKFDAVICADASADLAISAGLFPDEIIGDFDHGDKPISENVVCVPCEKDDTDTMLCIKRALSLGADEIFIAGGLGGRLDHTVANLQSLAFAEKNGVRATISDGDNEAFLITKSARVKRRDGYYFSLFAYGSACRDIYASGVKYPLCGGTLDTYFPLGVSNEITDDFADVKVGEGTLLAVFSRKEQI